MNWSQIPKYICLKIDNTNTNSFWKNNCDDNSKDQFSHIQSIAWNKICRINCEGGLGIRKIEHMNATFLAKQLEDFDST